MKKYILLVVALFGISQIIQAQEDKYQWLEEVDGQKPKTRTREIVLPNRTDLADDSYDNIIRRHIIKKWKFKKSLPENKKAKVVQDGIK